ncbi:MULTISPECIES: superoxide dismutase family protein [unclassified Paenibacillus]|uniref:superoxide dismutase family protein n=1 Tax=unclassified Paenibacillus TaxID=185978 RepID=UPI001AE7B266|nr:MULTISPECIES: superoxide dismutase family protein [unclassified Paenibacillus]MBP1155532.1 Cu-Zn family superoxide dismutase [Paenibacillus sp. PvP091]MBP1169082.1 Cu-Zn family superoxide dismutase [Paenibacillus sp. PvR098]MBP2440110.1 Cu-Zn family superoxide dismutase [Paenibacillus sp. PvP052]
MRFKSFIAAAAISQMLLLSGCQFGWSGAEQEKDPKQEVNGSSAPVMAHQDKESVLVELLGTQGQRIGQAKLTQVDEGVRIEVESSNLTPGPHGFHVHENGKCEQPDYQSAGGHFNPLGQKHGVGHPQGSHAGDLPNLEVDQEGKVKLDYVAKQLTLESNQPNSLLKDGGTSLVIHEKADDNVTEPAGNAGARIACGVIR